MLLGELRRNKGWSQEELAAKLGVKRPTVTCWEVGYRIPRWPMILKIAKLFEVEVGSLEFGKR
jgi:DNA-binding XRE family transcriptional regulator